MGRLREALEPFADYASQDGFGLDYHGRELPDGDGPGWVYVTNGDFRRARSALGRATGGKDDYAAPSRQNRGAGRPLRDASSLHSSRSRSAGATI